MAENVLDDLIKSIERFGITRTFNDDLISIMKRIDTVDIDDEDPDEQWEILQSNYRKIKYMYDLINFNNLTGEPKFMEALDKFMEIIDKQTQVYLQKIDWYQSEQEFRIGSIMIRDSLESSLNQNDTVQKLKYVIDAYRILIHIVEDLRNEKFESAPPEQEFLEEFERSYKRARKD